MKKYLAILGLVFCANCFADILPEGLSGEYRINDIINEAPQQTYRLEPLTSDREFVYGYYYIVFNPANNAFLSYYQSGDCGNGCAPPSSRGTYTMESEHRIRLHLTHISQDGDCEDYEKDVQQDLGVFLIETNEADGSMTLTALDALS